MDIAHKIENVKTDKRGRCIDDVIVVDCGVLEWFQLKLKLSVFCYKLVFDNL